MYKINDKVRLSTEGQMNENYQDFKDQTLIIDHIATNKYDHPGYDTGMNGMQLLGFNGILFSLYEYEIEKI